MRGPGWVGPGERRPLRGGRKIAAHGDTPMTPICRHELVSGLHDQPIPSDVGSTVSRISISSRPSQFSPAPS
jgi:hypothetical protein